MSHTFVWAPQRLWKRRAGNRGILVLVVRPEQDGSKPLGSNHVARERPVRAKVDSAAAMTEQEESELRAQLARLRQEHRDLDAAIEALQIAPGADILQIQRLKKRKLVLRDRITFIEDQLTPDIIA
jgi:hypothetical protein